MPAQSLMRRAAPALPSVGLALQPGLIIHDLGPLVASLPRLAVDPVRFVDGRP